MIGEKVKIELAARLIGAPDRRLQNREWAKADAIASVFARYQGNCQRKMWRGIKNEFFPKCGICACYGKSSTNGNIMNMREIVILDSCIFCLKISENEKIFLNFADF